MTRIKLVLYLDDGAKDDGLASVFDVNFRHEPALVPRLVAAKVEGKEANVGLADGNLVVSSFAGHPQPHRDLGQVGLLLQQTGDLVALVQFAFS